MFNAVKDVRLLQKITEQSKKEMFKNLKNAVRINQQCSICNLLTTASKYIGFWGLWNMFWWNRCLYANRKIEVTEGRGNF